MLANLTRSISAKSIKIPTAVDNLWKKRSQLHRSSAKIEVLSPHLAASFRTQSGISV
jgi:hypothetical protein